MRVVVVIAGTHISRGVAMFVDVPSIVVIAAIATCDTYDRHHHQKAGDGLVNHHLRIPSGVLVCRISTRTQNAA